MKKVLIPAILSAVLTIAACSQAETAPIAPKTEAAITTPAAATAPVTTVTTAAKPEKETTARTEAAAELSPKKEFPGDIELPVTYKHAENQKGKPCRSVMKGLEYEDFPAKEDIEPAIQCAFDAYFCKERVYHYNTEYAMEGIRCTIENLSFSSGLYLDFNGDGEKESLIVVENDSDMPFTGDSMVVYYRNEFENTVFSVDEKLADGGGTSSYIYALIYDDCIDVMIEEFFGASGQSSEVYCCNNGFKKEFALGKGSISPSDTFIGSYGWYAALGGEPPVYYIRTDSGYSLVGMEEIGLDALFEKIPEMRKFIEMIEDYYEEKVIGVQTEGYLNYFFFTEDNYMRAKINGDTLRSDFRMFPCEDFYRNGHWEGETEYGLCLL